MMGLLSKRIGAQFGNPRGLIGRTCCSVMNMMNGKMYESTLSLLELDPDDRVLDIGYGNGYLLRCISERTGATLYGIDISEDMRLLAEKKNRKAKAEGRLFLSTGDCCDLPYDDDQFDAVTSINTIYFWKDTVQGLSEIRRTLKPGCSFCNVVYEKSFLSRLSPFTGDFKKYDKEQLIGFGEQAGFNDIQVKEIVKGKSYAVIYTK